MSNDKFIGLKNEEEANGSSKFYFWSCPKCSLDNNNHVLQCEACGWIRNDIDTSTTITTPTQNSKSNLIKDFFGEAKTLLTQLLTDTSTAATSHVPPSISPSPQKNDKQVNIQNIDRFDETANTNSGLMVDEFVNNNKNIPNQILTTIQANKKPPLLRRQTSLKSLQIFENQKIEASEKEQEILFYCKQCSENFNDDTFPPTNQSLTYSGLPHPKAVKWLRPKDLSRNKKLNWKIFRNPRPTDIIQGTLGNCWFLSALAVVCERYEILQKIMLTKEVFEEGVFQVRLNKDGRWIVVIVDDYLPCNVDDQLTFSQAARHQLWVPIIEKAAAKAVGCYEGLIAGRCIEGLQMLTGSPCESIILHNKMDDLPEDSVDKDLVWVKLLSCRNAGYLMGASCGGDITDDQEGLVASYREMGLEVQHAYSLLDVQQVEQHRLIRLRNPWGHRSWKGRWSDESFEWTSNLRESLNAYGSDEGVFWISLEDMMHYFDCVDVCKYQPDWAEVTLEGVFGSPGQPGQVCHLTVFAPTELNISLFQKSNRGKQNESNASSDLFIGIYRASSVRSDPRPISYVAHSERRIKPSVLCNVFLEEGTYLIVPCAFNHWNSGVVLHEQPTYALSIHSSKPVLTDHITMTRYTYSDALFLLVEKLGKQHDGIPGVTCYYMSHKLAGLLVAAENRRSDVHLHVDCDCGNSFNVVSTRGSMQTNDCLPPLTRQILTVLTQLEGSDGYSVSHKLKFSISPFNAYNGRGSHQHPLLTNGLSEIHNPIPL